MATGTEVLEMLIPEGGWYILGDDFSSIEFIECDPIGEVRFHNGFAKVDQFKEDQAKAQEIAKAALLTKLGITAEEAALLLK